MHMTAAKLKDDFVRTYLGERSLGENLRTWHLRFQPKQRDAFKELELWVDVDGMPRQFQIIEHNGDTTTIQLSEIRKNEPVPGGIFRLKFPPDTKIIKA